MKENDTKYIIMDWNGTLLNDIDASIQAMNKMLSRRDLPLITKEHYLDVFGFPVKSYYERLGLNFKIEPFEELAVEYIDLYNSNLSDVKLFDHALELLSKLREKGYSLILLSAMEQNTLIRNLITHGADTSFDDIYGSFDVEAFGKFDIAQEVKSDYTLTPENAILIGDTIHDKEIADELNVHCILLSSGHQSTKRLNSTGCQVINGLDELPDHIDKFFK